jgi:hypothetical protein
MTIHKFMEASQLLGKISDSVITLKDERARNKIHTAVHDLANLLQEEVLRELKEIKENERKNNSRKISTTGE